MQQQSFSNPRIPFTGAIKGGLRDGTDITITGKVQPGAQRFQVDFMCGEDRALHFNPRYSWLMNYVVCNTLQKSVWGDEEYKHPNPLPHGSSFTVVFMVKPDVYTIVVNGVHFHDYKHRFPASKVENIFINGGVEIHSVTIQPPAQPVQSAVPTHTAPPMTFVVQNFAPPNAQSAPHQAAVCQPVTGSFAPQGSFAPRPHHPRGRGRQHSHKQHLNRQHFNQATPRSAPPPYTPSPTYAVPYKTVLQGGLYPGKSITIQGIPNQQADKFTINLRCNDGIVLHFNPRFQENTVVRNSLLNNSWGAEERSGGMPFHCGQPFTVMFVCDVACYRIVVNGIQMFTFNHRHSNHEETDILEVIGDVSLSSVQL